jgi:hypothetical protein
MKFTYQSPRASAPHHSHQYIPPIPKLSVTTDPYHPRHSQIHSTYPYHTMSTATYYEALGVHPTASINTIQAAYCKILQDNHPDVTRYQDFRLQAQADKRIRAASAAWQVLSNLFTRRSYDESLPPENPFNQWASTPGNTFGSSSPRNTFADTYAYPSEQ